MDPGVPDPYAGETEVVQGEREPQDWRHCNGPTQAKVREGVLETGLGVESEADEAGLCRKVMLKAKPPGSKPGLPFEPKALQRFQMSVQRLVLIYPFKEIPSRNTVITCIKARYEASITKISN